MVFWSQFNRFFFVLVVVRVVCRKSARFVFPLSHFYTSQKKKTNAAQTKAALINSKNILSHLTLFRTHCSLEITLNSDFFFYQWTLSCCCWAYRQKRWECDDDIHTLKTATTKNYQVCFESIQKIDVNLNRLNFVMMFFFFLLLNVINFNKLPALQLPNQYYVEIFLSQRIIVTSHYDLNIFFLFSLANNKHVSIIILH